MSETENNTASNANQEIDDFNIENELQKKIKLNDGSEEYLYARGPKYNEELWPVQCFLCRWTYITNEKKFRGHLKGERHLNNFKEAVLEPPNAEEYRKPVEQVYSDRNQLKNPIKIYPGEDIEDITPEYYDRLLPIKVYKWNNPPSDKLTEELTPDIIMDYNKKCPILGLCYAFKMAKDNKIRYHCALCKVDLNETNAYQHFISQEHSMAYLQAHYSETLKLLPADLTNDQKIDVIRFYYNKIEGWKGCRPFYLVNSSYFDAIPDRFLPRVEKIYHYNETTVKFSPDEILRTAKLIKAGRKLVPAFVSKLPNQPEDEEQCTKVDTSGETEAKPDEINGRRGAKRGLPDEKEDERIKRLGLDNSPATWQKYRLLSDKALAKLNTEYARFLDISERHPRYQEEWRRFYRMKLEQLRRDRVNPNEYNFMPDWNRYWMRYLEDCYNNDAEKCRYEIRKTLKLPFRGRTPPPTDNIIGKNSEASASSSDDSSKKKEPVPLMELAISNPYRYNFSNDIVGGGNSIPSNLNVSRGDGGGGMNAMGTNATAQPHPLIPDEQIQRIQGQGQNTETSGPISVLSVLRLLAALEFELGSLGPLVNQLLGKAVLYEKESKLSANELLHEKEYFTLFVTATEKLKGVMQAGVISDVKVAAAKKCISDLETILNLFEEYLRRNPNAAQKHITSNEVLKKSGVDSQIPKTEETIPIKNENHSSFNNGNKDDGIPSLMGNDFRNAPNNNPFASNPTGVW